MNKSSTFTIGAVAGIVTLTLAVPLLVQIAGAAGTSSSSPSPLSSWRSMMQHRIPTQQEVQAMADRDSAFLKNIDTLVTVEKTAKQAHLTALTAAAAIADDTQREAAVKKANEDERAAIQAAIAANSDLKGMMPFGPDFGGKGGPGMMGGRGENLSDLATKLGMSEADLKTALDGGKTIQEIAKEKGVTLPAPSMMGGRGPNLANLATKLGMSEADLQAALDSGKTIQQIAEEKGVTLPARTEGRGMHRGGMMNWGTSTSETTEQ
jgi:hypothetical protein